MRMKKVAKRLLGGALALAMAVGIFAGTGMEVRAEETWSIVPYTLPGTFDEVLNDCENVGDDEYSEIESSIIEPFINNNTSCVVMFKNNKYSNQILIAYYNNNFAALDLVSATNISGLKNLQSLYGIYILKKNTTSDSGSGLESSTSTPTDSNGASSSSNAPYVPHTHSYSWVTVQDASVGQDGLEEYRCSCGDVQGRSVIPASAVAVSGLYGAVKDAPQNGTASFDSGRLYTISDYVIKKLAERTDVTTVITFEYQNQAYKMTIPAGADYTPLLSDGDYFYGYFYFANAVGATIEAVGM